jgi:hypothetical protein
MRQDMRHIGFSIVAIVFVASAAQAQGLNKIVFGPLEGDDAGILTVLRNCEEIEVEMWVRTDPDNPSGVVGVAHALMSKDAIIALRGGAQLYPPYDGYPWIQIFVDGPFTHDPNDNNPIPEGHTAEIQVALFDVFNRLPIEPLNTFGEWVNYGAFRMTCNTSVPTDETYYPFSEGWYPHSGQGISWSFDNPPGGSITPDQDFCGLYFEPTTAVDDKSRMPSRFYLARNYPNPFNARSIIRYNLPGESDVTIDIFDILGRKVEILVAGHQPAGSHTVIWDAGENPSGVYFYRIQAGEYCETKSCLLLK